MILLIWHLTIAIAIAIATFPVLSMVNVKICQPKKMAKLMLFRHQSICIPLPAKNSASVFLSHENDHLDSARQGSGLQEETLFKREALCFIPQTASPIIAAEAGIYQYTHIDL